MKKIGLVIIAVVLTVSGFAQKSADLGIWGGTSTYWGDMDNAPPLQSFNINAGAFFRYNFNSRVAVRTQFLTGNFAADGTVENQDFSFSKNVQDISFMMEINYLKFVLGEKNTRFTPFIMAGLGVSYFPYTIESAVMREINEDHPIIPRPINDSPPRDITVQESVISAGIPLGFGIKVALGKRLGFGAEYQVRKLLNDKLDNLDDPLSTTGGIDNKTIKYTTLYHNNDWPGYLGINLTYKFFLNQKDCPAYDRKYW